MIRFMSDTRYAGLEKEMQHIPGFRPRRSGMVIRLPGKPSPHTGHRYHS